MNEEEKKRRMGEMKDGSLTDHVVAEVTDIRLHVSERENGVLVPYLSVFLDTENICGIFEMDRPSKKSKLEDIIKGLELIARLERKRKNEKRKNEIMMSCKKCGKSISEEEPTQNGMCIDCFANEWGELVELSPMVSPRILLSNK